MQTSLGLLQPMERTRRNCLFSLPVLTVCFLIVITAINVYTLIYTHQREVVHYDLASMTSANSIHTFCHDFRMVNNTIQIKPHPNSKDKDVEEETVEMSTESSDHLSTPSVQVKDPPQSTQDPTTTTQQLDSSIPSSQHVVPCTVSPSTSPSSLSFHHHHNTVEGMIEAMLHFSSEEQKQILDAVDGREFPYPLTCPKYTIDTKNHSVIVGYHIGMLKNWRTIVRDQMTTLDSCGLGKAMTQMYITYNTDEPGLKYLNASLEELQRIVRRYSFASKVQYTRSPGIPFEGTAMNLLLDSCLHHESSSSSNRTIEERKDPSEKEKDAVAFFMHSKGASRYTDNWRDWKIDPSFKEKPDNYARVLHWRKYMEYFLLERPEICLDKILYQNAQACGVFHMNRPDHNRRFYGGTFWAASCRYLRTLPKLAIGSNYDDYEKGENWIGSNIESYDNDRFVNLHDPSDIIFWSEMLPEHYSDYYFRWKFTPPE